MLQIVTSSPVTIFVSRLVRKSILKYFIILQNDINIAYNMHLKASESCFDVPKQTPSASADMQT